MPKRAKPFATEEALCADFIAWVKPQGWAAYAETAGWDILLVSPQGRQIGVQAKLTLNLKVLTQALDYAEAGYDARGPDHRAVLVPEDRWHLVTRSLGLILFSPCRRTGGGYSPGLNGPHCDFNPAKRCKLPEYMPDVAAGVSAPVQLTEWKIGALKIAAMMAVRGFVTRDDFRKYGVNPSRWYSSQQFGPAWMLPGTEKGQWVRGPGLTFDSQHPDVYKQIMADVIKLGDVPQRTKSSPLP